jgi:hypothetical protein
MVAMRIAEMVRATGPEVKSSPPVSTVTTFW